jgi:Lon-like protease
LPKLHFAKISNLATYALVALALTVGILWIIPANYYLVFPGSAQQVSSMISVQGKQYHPSHGELLDTYVNQLKASHLLYVLFGLLRPDVTVEPAAAVSSGCPDNQYEEQLLEMMADSKYQAEAAALYATGHSIKPETWGPEVDQVSCGFPAASVLKPGDRILAVDGHAITGRTPNGRRVACPPPPPYTVDCGLFTQVKAYTVARPPGSVLHLKLLRSDKVTFVAVRTVHANRDNIVVHKGGHAMIGIIMVPPLKFLLRVNVSSGDVGGPSAGLAFTLGIIQQLTHRDLTHGNLVAVTGTMMFQQYRQAHGGLVSQALVGAIGGARQKALAAQAAGAKYFLVPYLNYHDAVSAHADLKVIPVATLTQALHVLNSLPSPKKSAASS